jgi:predicted metalloprotease
MLKIQIRQKIFLPLPLKVKFDESYSKYRDNKMHILRVYKQIYKQI